MHVAGNEHFLKPYRNACVTNYKIKGHCRDVPFLSPPPPTKDGKFFSNMPMKNKLFRFHFSKSADKSLRVQIPVIPAGVWIENGMSHMSTLTIKVVRPTQQIMAPI